MIINKGNLTALALAFKAAFQGVLGQAPSQYLEIATVVPSTTGAEEYGWLGSLPNVREWVGDRVVHGITSHGYTIRNKSYELTVAVPRPAIEDDQYGVYTPLMAEMGRSMGAHPDQLCYGLLAAGRTEKCYDGQAFFSKTHPVTGANGKDANQANLDDSGGANAYWYVLDTSRALKPLIFQNRKAPNFVSKTAETDDNVFDRAEYVYGADRRCNVGFGFWQLAYASNKTLDAAGLKAAIVAMTSRKGDNGRPLGINPTVLVVPPTLEFEARQLLENAVNEAGATNELKGRLKVQVASWL
ncbi:Mu-like prophage major head subunit gpT family protein [Fulvimonas yonginensis]|uniref:Mu-like prophage major head subunit gpT family protein n=1 Tax=Fulvimonas yonginensis TaxID=1495200 RepID=A0ABU8JB60_9GAMM